MRVSSGALLLAALSAVPAQAASSNWAEADGGRARLVTSGVPDGDGRLRGALQIQLKPGWKTYWRDPGEAGVPPTIDVSASRSIRSASLDFPAPERHMDGDYAWAGYGHSVSLPVVFETAPGVALGAIDAAVFLGICETICVPLQATLAIDPSQDADAPDDAAIVDDAFEALPRPASRAFGIELVKSEADDIVVEVHVPEGDAAELFLAGSDDYLFGVPEAFEEGGKPHFRIPVTRPDSTPSGHGFHYTLVTRSGAVSGLLPFF
ncbi:MAG: hypothetical protein KF914_17910 [Rhizobiaceae bacterium]|nr:hypothetical protein [Rhizobiaceae bacterium]